MRDDRMSALSKHRDALEVHETMMGSARGRIAVALDIALVLEQIGDAKQLLQSAIELERSG